MDDSQIINSRLSELIALQKRLEDIEAVLASSKVLNEKWHDMVLALSRLIDMIISKKVIKAEIPRHVIMLIKATIFEKINLVDDYINEGRSRNVGHKILETLSSLLTNLLELFDYVKELESKF